MITIYSPVTVVITINNSAIVIIFNTTSILLLSGIALTLFIEIMDKELLKYEVENIRWWYMTDFSVSLGEKGLFLNIAVAVLDGLSNYGFWMISQL